jgi:O-glycosyl hydrolase
LPHPATARPPAFTALRRPSVPLALAAVAAAAAVAGLAAPARADAPAVAAVRVLAPAQTLTGFGASGAWWPNDADDFSASTRARIARLLFDRRSGLGLSIYRYNIGGGGVGVAAGPRAPRSFLAAPGTYDWSADPGGTAFLRQAARYGVRRLVGFANTAPRFFTTNGRSCGGGLRGGRVANYANYLARVAAHMRATYGIRLATVSPMNEPTSSFADCHQEGMHVPPSQRATVIDSVARALAARSPGTKVSADESTTTLALGAGFARWIGPHVATVSFHGYDFPTAARLRAVAGMVRARTAARTEMTEVCCSTGAGYARGYNPGMTAGLWLANTIWRDLSAGGVSSFSWWTALSPELGCAPASDPACAGTANARGWNDGLLYYDPDFRTDGNQSIYFTRRYWVLANFSRYIRPGAVHYRVTGVPAHVHVIAFRRNMWRFVMINDAAGRRTVRLGLLRSGGHRYGTPSVYTTSATQDLAPTGAASVHGSTLTTSLPGRSVTTVIVPW